MRYNILRTVGLKIVSVQCVFGIAGCFHCSVQLQFVIMSTLDVYADRRRWFLRNYCCRFVVEITLYDFVIDKVENMYFIKINHLITLFMILTKTMLLISMDINRCHFTA